MRRSAAGAPNRWSRICWPPSRYRADTDTVSGAGRRMLSFLTVRGRCVAAGGVTLLLVGAALGERALVQLAVFVLALPLLAVLLVSREQFRLTAGRTVPRARLPRVGGAEVTVEIGNA